MYQDTITLLITNKIKLTVALFIRRSLNTSLTWSCCFKTEARFGPVLHTWCYKGC